MTDQTLYIINKHSIGCIWLTKFVQYIHDVFLLQHHKMLQEFHKLHLWGMWVSADIWTLA